MLSFAKLSIRYASSGAARKIVSDTGNIVRKGAAKENLFAGLFQATENTATQVVKKITTADIRTSEFNSIISKIRVKDPIVAESIEKRLSAYNLNSEKGLAKAKDMISSVVSEYSGSEETFIKQVTNARNLINESARKAAEIEKMHKISGFLEEIKSYNPELGEKLATKVEKLEEISPKRAETFVNDLINRYGNGRNAANSYAQLQERYSPRLYENIQLKRLTAEPYATFPEPYSTNLHDDIQLNTLAAEPYTPFTEPFSTNLLDDIQINPFDSWI